jgi:hypothetical protein
MVRWQCMRVAFALPLGERDVISIQPRRLLLLPRRSHWRGDGGN